MHFLDEDIYEAVKNYLPKVSEYVNSHGGGLKLLGVKDGVVYIELTGACGGCSMSLMTTENGRAEKTQRTDTPRTRRRQRRRNAREQYACRCLYGREKRERHGRKGEREDPIGHNLSYAYPTIPPSNQKRVFSRNTRNKG